MRILLIANTGGLLDELFQKFNDRSHVVDVFEVKKNNIISCSQLLGDLQCDYPVLNVYDSIVFVSGETRNKKYMELLNYEFPSHILGLAHVGNVPFVYLSSLAVFAGCYEDRVSVKTPLNSLDKYGYSKAKFDKYVREFRRDEKNAVIGALYPASFYSGSGRSSIEKYDRIINRFGLIFKFVGFNGCLSYIDRRALLDELVSTVEKKDYKDRILARHYHLSMYKSFFVFPVLPMYFFEVLGLFLPRFSLKLRMLVRGIRYE